MANFKKIMSVFIIITVINFLLFFLISLIIGGGAINGKVLDGHYYLYDHGEYTEVSHFVYSYSVIHFYSVIIVTLFLGFPAVSYLATTLLRRESKNETNE